MTGLLRLRWMKASGGHEVREHPVDEGLSRVKYGGLWVAPKALRRIDIWRGEGFHEFLKRRPTYVAHLGEDDIYLDLANTECTPEGVITFVDRWGLLDHEAWFSLNSFYEVITTMKAAVKQRGQTTAARVFAERLVVPLQGIAHPNSRRAPADPLYAGSLNAHFEWENSQQPRLYFAAGTLWQFCLLEHLHALAGEVDMHVCECGNYVRPPKRGGPPRKHCSDRCKMKAYRKRGRALRTRTQR